MRLILAALFSLAVLAAVPAVAAESCSGFQSTCAARCKQRAPTDLSCVADHCTPQLRQCRTTGCWQEGELSGGRKTCNLKKS